MHAKKGKDEVKKARDNCGQTKKGPKPADIAQKTGVIEPRVKEILVALRDRIVKKKQRCNDILEAANELLSTPAADGDAQTETHGSHVPTVEQSDENGGDVQIPAATSPAADGDAQTEAQGPRVLTSEQPETEQPVKKKTAARKQKKTSAMKRLIARKQKRKRPPAERYEGPLDTEEDVEHALNFRAQQGIGLEYKGRPLTSERYKTMVGNAPPSRRAALRADVKRKARSGYIKFSGYKKTTKPPDVRSCLHDAIMNAATRVRVTIDKKKLWRQCKPVKTKERSFAEVVGTDEVSSKLSFTYVNPDNAQGGNEAFLLSLKDGVYVVQSQIDGKTTSQHAFVYDARGTVPEVKKDHCGMIIDNRKNKPIYLIEPKDRKDVDSKRGVLNKFWNVSKPGRVFVMHIYRVEPVTTEQQADAQGISDYKRKQRENGTATGAYDYSGNGKTDEIDLTDSPPAKKAKARQ
eukprot:COSAG02_NODE_7961_length_2771_cov_1.845808_2_plen_463_part_00